MTCKGHCTGAIVERQRCRQKVALPASSVDASAGPLLFNQFHPGILSTDHFPPSATAVVLQQQGMPQGHVETTRDLKKHQDS